MFFSKNKNRKSPNEIIKRSTEKLRPQLQDNIDYIRESFNHTEDLKQRDVVFQKKQGTLLYLATMVDPQKITENILSPLEQAHANDEITDIMTTVDLKTSPDLLEAISAMLEGYSVFIHEGMEHLFLLGTIQVNDRTPDEPENEKVVRGSHQGFIENLTTNINLVRQRIKSRELTVKYFTLGTESNTEVALVYMNDLASPDIVQEVERRLLSISMDTVFAPGFLEESIEEFTFSPFPQNLYTERPDRLKAHLMEGRIAIFAENSTDVIVLPITFFSLFQSPDDFNNRFYEGSVFRLLRFFSFLGTLLLPPLYIAVVGFHFEIIPYELITLVKSSIETVPFTPFFEALIMAVTIELIREAGIRLPSPIGETIGIVGGLIIGDAVVSAGIVSNMMVIVIALTAIMSFAIPSYELGNAVRLLSFPIMIAAALFGFVGIVFSLLFILIHMCKLQSFGTPYLSPFVPLHVKNLKDTFIRLPIWMLNERPKDIDVQNQLRQRPSREWAKK